MSDMHGRETIVIVEIDQPFCTREWGDAFGSPPGLCTAALSSSFPRKCHNTRFTCAVPEVYNPGTLTLRFTRDQDGLTDFDPIVAGSLIDAPGTSAGSINLGGMDQSSAALGVREQVQITLADHQHPDTQVDKYRLERFTGEAELSGGEVDFDFVTNGETLTAFHGAELAEITFTRAGATATRVNASGLIEVVAADTPRFDYDPSTLQCRGLLIEEQRANLCLQSNNFLATWAAVAGTPGVVQDSFGLDGAISAWTITDNDPASYEGIYQSWTVANDSLPHVFSIYVRKTTGAVNTFGINFHLGGGTPVAELPRLNTNSGVAVPVSIPVEDCGDYWRLTTTVTNNSSGNTTLMADFYPATGTNNGNNPGFDVATAVGSAVVTCAQLEKASKPSSYIPTTTAAVTRNADVAKVNDISSFYNASEGTLVAEAMTRNLQTADHTGVAAFNDGTGNNSIKLELAAASGIPVTEVFVGGVQQAALVGSAYTPGNVLRVAFAYKANDFAFSADGNAASTDASGSVPTVDRLLFGTQHLSTFPLNGHLRRLTYYPRRLTNDELVELSGSDLPPSAVVQFSNAFNPNTRGTFWGKWLARNPYYQHYPLRVYEGYAGDAIEDMRVRHYLIDSIDGPNDGEVTIDAKDLFVVLETQKAVAPLQSRGRLSAALSGTPSSFTITPTEIIEVDYPAEAGSPSELYVAIGDEIIRCSRSGAVCSILQRACFGTEQQDHDQDDKVQWVLRYVTELSKDITYALLTDYTTLDVATAINTSDWSSASETLTSLYTAVIAEPTPVSQLIGELMEQDGFTVVPNVTTGMVDFIALRAASSALTADDDSFIVDGSIQIEHRTEWRASEIWVHYGKRNPLQSHEDAANYHSVVVTANTDKEDETQYGSQAIKKIFSRWIPQFGRNQAVTTGERLLAMFQDPPIEATFSCHASRLGDVSLGGLITLAIAEVQDASGEVAEVQHAITRIKRAESEGQITSQEVVFAVLSSETERTIYIENDSFNLNLRSIYDSLYSAPLGGSPTELIRFIIENSVTVGSTSTSTPALTTGTWPAGVQLTLENRGRIQGRGGDGAPEPTWPSDAGVAGSNGGPALETTVSLIVDNTAGEIFGGGGGGGSGGRFDDGHLQGSSTGSGGGGAGTDEGLAGFSSLWAGQESTTELGGDGGVVIGPDGNGGRGGDPGQDGSAGNASFTGQAGGAGGLKGSYIVGNSLVTWIALGDARGGITA